MQRASSSQQPSTRVALTALAIFAGALLLRVGHVWQIRSAPFFTLLMGDSRAYDEWAQRLAAGDWIGREVFYQAPLYPYFLGVVYRLLGRDLFVIRIIQSAIGSMSCVLLYLAGRRFFSERVGVLAGAALALWAPAIFFDALVQKSVLDVFFVCLTLWTLSRAESAEFTEYAEKTVALRARRSLRFRFWWWVGIGVALGALALTRENALIFIVILGVYALLTRGGWRNAAALAAGVAVLLLPVAVRNASMDAGGFFVTTSQFGPNLYIGNHDGADGTYQSLRYGRGAPEYERQDATELAERALHRRLTPAEVSSYWSDRALTFMTAQPVAWLSLMARKVLLLVNATEMLDTESQETHAEWSWPLRLLAPVTHFGVLFPLALFGIFVSWSRSRAVRMLIALTAGYAASVVIFYVFARYRYPLVPLLIVFAAAGLYELPAAVKHRRMVPIAAVAVAAVACNWPMMPRDWLKAVTENNLAVALQSAGRYDEAVVHYQRATALRHDYAPAMNNLGTALRAAGRVDEAVAAYQRALAAHPDFPDAHYNLANALTDVHRGPEAIEHFEVALASLPASPDVHNNLGIALAAQGRVNEAIDQFREAVREDPQSPKAHRNLGDSLISAGQVDDGIREMREAAALAPTDGGLRYDLGSALLEAGRADEAATELREAVARLPQSAEAQNNLGIALGTIGRFEEAVDQFQAALTLKPDFADARKNLEMARAARRRSP